MFIGEEEHLKECGGVYWRRYDNSKSDNLGKIKN